MTASDGTLLADGKNSLALLEDLPEYCVKGYVVLRHTSYGEGRVFRANASNEVAKALYKMTIDKDN